MHKRHDQLGKRMLQRVYEGCGTITSEEEISADAQRFDSYFVPDPGFQAPDDDLLYVLGATPAAFEIFQDAPSAEDLVECVRKLLNARHVFGLAKPPKPLPYLWVLCAGHPKSGLEALSATPADQIAPGVQRGPSAFSTGIVTLSRLPETRSTLLLRLLGTGETRRRALAELASLPEDARERQIAVPVLVQFRYEITAAPGRTADDEEFLMQTVDYVKQLRDEGRKEGRDEGRKEGLDAGRKEGLDQGRKEMLLGVYRARFGAVPREVQAAVHRAQGESTLTAWVDLFANRSAEEILAALTLTKLV